MIDFDFTIDISWWISDAAARTPTKTAVRLESRDVTYRMLEERVAVLAGQLREAGVVDGDRIAYFGPSCPELLESLFACARLGAIFVPLNARMPAAELQIFVEQSRPRALIAERSLVPTAREVVGQRRVLAFSVGEQ